MNSFLGTAQNVDWNSVRKKLHILTFRVEVSDEFGNIKYLVPVEFRYSSCVNIVSEGHRVEARGEYRNNVLQAVSINNISTNASISNPKFSAKNFISNLMRFLVFFCTSIGIFKYAEQANIFGNIDGIGQEVIIFLTLTIVSAFISYFILLFLFKFIHPLASMLGFSN